MRNKTAEEAYLEMLKPGENIKIKTQYRIEEFNKIKELPGDGFYIRYLSMTGNDSVRLLGLNADHHMRQSINFTTFLKFKIY